MTQQELEDKSHSLVAPRLGEKKSRRVENLLRRLERAETTRPLMEELEGEDCAWLSPLPDDSSDRLFAERRWKKLGVNPRPGRNHDQNILRMIGNPDVLRIACDLKQAGAALKNPALLPFGES